MLDSRARRRRALLRDRFRLRMLRLTETGQEYHWKQIYDSNGMCWRHVSTIEGGVQPISLFHLHLVLSWVVWFGFVHFRSFVF